MYIIFTRVNMRGSMINKLKLTALSVMAGLAVSPAASAEEITIATVNNADMITMQELAPAWEESTCLLYTSPSPRD